MKLFTVLAAIFTCILAIALIIAAEPILPAIATLALIIILGLLLAAGGVGVYWLFAHAQYRRAQGQAVLLEASKIHADNSAFVMKPGQIVQLQGGPLGYGVISNITNYSPHYPQVAPAQVALVEPAGLVEAAGPLELPAANFYDYVPADPFRRGELFLTLGMGANGSVITRPITKLTHFLPAGKTNSGKSTFLRSLAAQALIGELSQPGRARVALIDLTGITFNPDLFSGLPQVWGGGVVQTDAGAVALVNNLLAECKSRAALYSQAPGLPESLPEFNAVVPPAMRLPVVIVFIEEMSALSDFAGKSFLSPLKQLLWTARKFGIYLVNTGQDFRANVIDKSITDNSSSRFLFGGVDDTTARVIGFDPKQHKVSVDRPGRGLVMLNKEVQEFHSLFLEKPDFINLVNQLRVSAGLREVAKTAQAAPQSPQTHNPMSGAGPVAQAGQDVVTAEYRELLPAAPGELERARRAWQAGNNTVRKLASALGVSIGKAQALRAELRAQGYCS